MGQPKTLKQQFEEILPTALVAGIRITEYWDLTIAEIIAVIDAYEEAQKNDAIKTYNLACMTATFTALASRGKDLPRIEEIYPKYFKKNEEAENERLKAAFTEYALEWNRQRAQRKNDS